MTTKYYHNGVNHEIRTYTEEMAGYELKCLLYGYGDAITIGFKTREEAEKWDKEWKYNKKTKSMDKVKS